MQYIISREIENLYTFAVTDEILEELRLCVRDYLKRYIDHEFKALELIKTL
jgi:DNA repair protein RecO (recombination protein O)